MGNGKATAILFAQEGAKVVVADINLQAAEETAAMIASAGGEAMAYRADVTNEAEAQGLIEATVAKYGKVDILFNNVGIGGGRRGLKVSVEDWDRIMNVNLKSVLFMCKHAVPKMIEAGGGAIVNNSSMAGFYSHPLYAYSVSKAGVIALTKCLAASLAKNNIRVNCVAPGYMDTPMVAGIMDETRLQLVETRVPLKRHGTGEETAATVLFLVSSDASYITGQTICVDGGMSVR